MRSLPLLWIDHVKCNCSNSYTKFLVLPWDTFSTATFHHSSLPNQPICLWLFMSFPSPHSLVGQSHRTIFLKDRESMSWASSFAVAWLRMLQDAKQDWQKAFLKGIKLPGEAHIKEHHHWWSPGEESYTSAQPSKRTGSASVKGDTMPCFHAGEQSSKLDKASQPGEIASGLHIEMNLSKNTTVEEKSL